MRKGTEVTRAGSAQHGTPNLSAGFETYLGMMEGGKEFPFFLQLCILLNFPADCGFWGVTEEFVWCQNLEAQTRQVVTAKCSIVVRSVGFKQKGEWKHWPLCRSYECRNERRKGVKYSGRINPNNHRAGWVHFGCRQVQDRGLCS